MRACYTYAYMTNAYKTKLEAMLDAITKELETVSVHDTKNIHDWVPVSNNPEQSDADVNVSADAREDFEEKQSLVATLESDYNDILHALEKIEHGTFGVCEVCGSVIEESRLVVLPTARTCISHRETERL